jgi:hypothetical protein
MHPQPRHPARVEAQGGITLPVDAPISSGLSLTAHSTRTRLNPALQHAALHRGASRRASGNKRGACVGRSRPAADHDDRPHGVRAMAASAMFLMNADVPYDGPSALELSRRHSPGLVSLDYKIQGMDVEEPCGHLERVLADRVSVLVTASHSTATVHVADRDQPPGPFQAGGVDHLSPLIEADARKLRSESLAVHTGAPQAVFLFCQARRRPCTCSSRRAPSQRRPAFVSW